MYQITTKRGLYSICQGIIDFIYKYQFFCVLSHESPDLDSLCSQLALVSLLTHLEKEVIVASSGPFVNNDVRDMQPLFYSYVPTERLGRDEKACVLLVDCANLSRTGFGNFLCKGMCIDHHACTEKESFKGYIDPLAPSTTLLVYRLMKAFQYQPTKQDIENILLGFCADTGFFRHLTPQAAPFLTDVGELLAGGVPMAQIYNRLEGQFVLASRQYLGKLLSGCQAYAHGQLIMVVEEQWDAAIDRDSPSLYRLLLSVEGVEVVVVMRRKDNGYSVGVRSRNQVNVGQIAASLGGGGHVKAAGFFTTKTPEEIKEYFIKAINTKKS